MFAKPCIPSFKLRFSPFCFILFAILGGARPLLFSPSFLSLKSPNSLRSSVANGTELLSMICTTWHTLNLARLLARYNTCNALHLRIVPSFSFQRRFPRAPNAPRPLVFVTQPCALSIMRTAHSPTQTTRSYESATPSSERYTIIRGLHRQRVTPTMTSPATDTAIPDRRQQHTTPKQEATMATAMPTMPMTHNR